MLIRRERPTDHEAVAAVHRSAFADQTPSGASEPVEVGLVTALRASDAWVPALSLVAEDPAGTVIGHVCLTRATVGDDAALALGPIGVLAERQGTGAGSALMHAALGAADALDAPLVALLGHLDYYPRFGFVPAAQLAIRPEVPEWADHFQVRTLDAYRPDITGEFRYARPFHEL